MMTKGLVRALSLLALLVAVDVHASDITWWYADASYQSTSDNDTDGYLAEVSGHVAKNWVLQSRVDHLGNNEDNVDVTQTRFDLAVGRVFRLARNVEALASAGYTYVDFDADYNALDYTVDEGSSMMNMQLALRAVFFNRLDAEASIGILADDEDTSDLLWSTVLRYHVGQSFAVYLGVSGSDQEYSYDDVVYRLGFRFDLSEKN